MAISGREKTRIKKLLEDGGLSAEKIAELLLAYDDSGRDRSELINRRTNEKKRLERQNGTIVRSLKFIGLDDAVDSWSEIRDLSEEINEIHDERVELEKKTNKNENDNLKLLELQNEELRLQNRKRELAIRNIKSGLQDIYKVGKDLLDTWGKIDQAASKFSKSVGMGARGMEAMRKSAIGNVARGHMGANYNMSADELLALQENYMNQVGRRVSMSFDNQQDAAALTAIMGDKGTELAIALEKFGLSYTEAGSKAAKMFKDAGKYGLSFQKYADNVQKGLAIAQNYTFKNGVNGMMEMAKRATAIKLDMQQIANFADKVSSVEGSVEVGSKLQVLGGPFSAFSDPLGMLHEGLNDPAKLMKRFESMTGGLASYDASKGHVDVSSFNRQRIRAAAEAMGMDYGQVMESVLAQGTRKEVGRRIASMGYDKDAQELIKNSAVLNEGRTEVTYVDDKGKSHTVDLAKEKLGEDALKFLQKSTNSQADNIRDIAIQLRGWDDMMKGTKKQYDNVKAQVVETVGIGKGIKSVISSVGTSNALLTLILGAITGGKIINGIGKVFSGFGGGKGNIFTKMVDFISGGRDKGFLSTGGVKGKGNGWTTFGNFKEGLGTFNGKTALGNITSAQGLVSAGIGIAAGEIIAGIGRDKRKNLAAARASGEIERGAKEDRKRNTGSKLWEFGGHGAAAGSVLGTAALGPGLGTAIGAAAGAILGATAGAITAGIQNKNNVEAKAKKDALRRQGLSLSGDYNRKQMEEIQAAINNGNDGTITKTEFEALSEETRRKMLESGDVGLFKSLEHLKVDKAEMQAENVNLVASGNITIDKNAKKLAASGGLLIGPSHSGGGMPILGSDVEVEGGEFVVNKVATKNNMGLLKAINGNGMNGLKVTPPVPGSVNTPSSMSIEPINININGTIRLEGSNGRSVDITDDILKNSVFINQITRLIEKQMNMNQHGGFVVNKGLYH